MWRAITYVTSGLTLVAFVVAASAWAFRTIILQKERQIKLAPENERSVLIRDALEFFSINTTGLTSKQQYNLAVKQVHARAMRFRTTAVVVTIVAGLTAGVATFALWRENKPIENPTTAIKPEPSVPSASATSLQTPTPTSTRNRTNVPVTSSSVDDRNQRAKSANDAMDRPARPTPEQ